MCEIIFQDFFNPIFVNPKAPYKGAIKNYFCLILNFLFSIYQ